MSWIHRRRDAIAFLAGLLGPLAVAAVLAPLRATFADTAAALVLVVVVVAVAANGSRLAGFLAACSAGLWFDFFLTKPYERFAITARSDIETAISLVAVGLAVTELAVRNRRHQLVAEEESDYVGLIYYLGQLVAEGTPAGLVIDQARSELTDLLHLRACHFAERPADPLMTTIERDGTVNIGTILWPAHQTGLPGAEVELPVHGRGELLGHFVLKPTPGWPVSLQRRLVAVAIADQVGAAMLPGLRSA